MRSSKKGRLTFIVNLAAVVVLLLAFAPSAPSAAPPPSDPDAYKIELQSRQFVPERGISSEVGRTLEDRGGRALARGATKIHTILQLDDIPGPAEKERLGQQGIELLTYIPNYAWLASIPANDPAGVASIPGVRWVGDLTVQDKVQPELQVGELTPWAYDPASDRLALLVQLHRNVSLEEGRAAVEAHGGQVVDQVALIHTLTVHLDREQVAVLAAEDVVEWIEQPLPPLEPINAGNRARVGADTLQSPPYSLDGTGVDVLVYDGGRVYSHPDLDSKRTWGDTAGFSEHATHVACTVLGDGTKDYNNRGMAPNADLLSMGFQYDGSGVFLYTNPGDIQNDLGYAQNTWSPSADLFNASIASNVAANEFPCSYEGNYGATAQLVDDIVRGSLGEPFIAAWANGNERGYGTCGTTYYTVPPPACAKNPIHSGATNSANDAMTSFSSWGPCDDGRLKPTISAPGLNVKSCNDSDGYTTMSGTSMASPTTAGIIALMLEQYRDTYSTSGEFLPSTAKALLMHTAVDLGNSGPDYQFGYGRIDGVAATDVISNTGFREETITAHGQIDEYAVAVSDSPSELRVSLAWDDAPGSLAALKKLVNDLDLEVESPDGTVYYPWLLDPSNPGNPATTGIDDINNQEQVLVSAPRNGTWTVRVRGTIVPDAPQSYSLVFTGAGAASKRTIPGSGPPDPPYTTCSEALTNGSFESGTSPWVWNGSAGRNSTYAYSGTYSGRAGGTSDGVFYQEIVLSSDFYSGTLSYWVRMNTSETPLYWYDYFDVEIRDGSDNILTTLQSLNNLDSEYQGTWNQETFALGAEYAGQTIRLRFVADVDSSINTYWYIDDVSLDVCEETVCPEPAAPSLTSPANGSSTCDTTPAFSWGSVSEATSYRIQVDDDPAFGSPAIDATSSSTSYTPGTALSPDTYYWRVRGSNFCTDGDWSSAWSVTILPTPSVTTLSSPPNGSSTCSDTPTFSWNSVSGAASYRIQVDDDPGFGSPVINETTSNTSYTPGTALVADTYYWRVRAINACGEGTWSSSWSINALANLSAPTLASPEHGSSIDDTTPTFSWGSVSGADSYRIQVDDDSGFGSPMIDETISDTSHTPGTEMALGTYYWRVQALNSCDSSPWSEQWFEIEAIIYLPLVLKAWQ